MPVVGLTGGIASGKTTVCGFFQAAGAYILDADQMARQVVMPGEPAWQDIIRHFGKGVLGTGGALDRVALGNLVFSDEAQRKILERIVHPRVRQAMNEATARLCATQPEGLIIQDVPLLLETGMDKELSEIIVVYLPEAIQIKRLMARDGISREQALSRIRAQMPMEEKRRRATMVIDNSGSLDQTRDQAMHIYGRIKAKTG